MRFAIAIAASLFAVIAGAATARERLYVVQCDGHVDVVARDGKRLRRVDVAAHLPIKRRQSVAGATFDNCLLNQALYIPARHRFFSLVPDFYSEPQQYGLWSFSLSSLTPRLDQPPSIETSNLPLIVEEPDGSVTLAQPDARSSPIDLRGFANATDGLRSEILETSGGAVLLRLYEPGSSELVLAVADMRRKTLVRLTNLPSTTVSLAHLVPGGAEVYVEQATGSAKTPMRTGKATLYDAATGGRIREIADARIGASIFLCVIPSGNAIYVGNGGYTAVALGSRFPAVSVRPLRPVTPSYFVAP